MKYKICLCLLIIPAFVLIFSSCQKDNSPEPYEECRLTGMQDAGGGARSFVYNKEGLIKTFNLFQGGFNTKLELSYDDKGLLISSLYTYDTELGLKEKYTYEDGRIIAATRVDPREESSVWGVRRLKYDQEGRIIEFTNEYGASTDSKYTFEYDAEGIQTRFEVASLSGDLQFRQVVRPSGTPVRSSENFLLEHGLPYELPYGNAYAKTSPGIGSVMETYGPDSEGRIILLNTLTLKFQKTGSKGFVEQIVWSNNDGEAVTNYSFAGCD